MNRKKKLIRFSEFLQENTIKLKKSLGIPRYEMPQIREVDIEEFIKFLKNKNIKVLKKKISLSKLKATQEEVNFEKIKKKHRDFKRTKQKIKPFIVSKDNHILDGHHQLFALKEIIPNAKVNCYLINLKITQLLNMAKKFSKVFYKSINE